MGKTIVGVMGPGEGASGEDVRAAFELGELIAREGWVLVTGGRRAGVMDAASRGASAAGGLVPGPAPGARPGGCVGRGRRADRHRDGRGAGEVAESA